MRLYFFLGLLTIMVASGVFFFKIPPKFVATKDKSLNTQGLVSLKNVLKGDFPKIAEGELVLGEFAGFDPKTQAGRSGLLGIISANLVPLVNNNSLAGVRIFGEFKNNDTRFVSAALPIIKFFDKEGKTISQRIGEFSEGARFFGLEPDETSLYDVSVMPAESTADKIEISFQSEAATASSGYWPLKIENRNLEVKTASNSATHEEVTYYSFSGNVYNERPDYVTDISLAVWVKNKENKVIAIGRENFKNDLLAPSGKLGVKLLVLPLKGGENFENYNVSIWGKQFKKI